MSRDKMDEPVEHNRLSYQESMELLWLDEGAKSGKQTMMSRQPAWYPGKDAPWESMRGSSDEKKFFGRGAFGGHVYAQAPLAAARVVEKEDAQTPAKDRLGIHSIHGVFTNPGFIDRPFIYEVAKVFSSRSFSTHTINARQPKEPSGIPNGPFPPSDAQLPLGDVCFTCVTTFKRPVTGPSDVQDETPPQKRFASILESRAPDEWEASPQADIDLLRETFPIKGHASFPILDMYKVDMTEFNKDKAISDRRQLILYRLYKPLPAEDVNAHITCHAYEADRNGFIMLGNHLGYGYNMGPVASLSYSFYVHVNAEEAVMRGDGWWIQEVYWPRVNAGRGMMESRIWSPEGLHVASGYQDGICLPARSTEKARI
ncbi:hypothetical protein V2G26_017793 [Clonostachys chloroleuca]